MSRFGRNLWLYLSAAMLWSVGLMTFFLAYNLYLLDLGFQEKFIGQVSASMTFGSLAATLPSAFLLNRFGLNRVIRSAVLCTAATLLVRCCVDHPLPLLLSAFLNGASLAAWFVAAPPFLAENTDLENRSRAFSLNYGGSIGMGVLAGFLIGHLSKVANSRLLTGLSERRFVLISAAGIVLVALVMLVFLTSNSHATLRKASTAALSPLRLSSLLQFGSHLFFLRLIIVLMLWSAFLGSFPPFFNVFFAKRFEQPLSGIGLIFSLSQFCQVLAVFSMPWVVRQLGRVPAISSMQLASSVFLPLLPLASHVQLAGLIYLIYLSAQVMAEPALENFIMDSVPVDTRNLASAIRYMTHFLVQAIAVWVMGFVIEKFGYTTPLTFVAFIGILAACSFYFLFRSVCSLVVPATRKPEAVS
jgi:MFS family permease